MTARDRPAVVVHAAHVPGCAAGDDLLCGDPQPTRAARWDDVPAAAAAAVLLVLATVLGVVGGVRAGLTLARPIDLDEAHFPPPRAAPRWMRVGLLAAVALVVGLVFGPRPYAAHRPVAEAVTVRVTSTGLATSRLVVVHTSAGPVLHPIGSEVRYRGVRGVAAAIASAGGDVSCVVTVNGVAVDEERASGPGALALCTWAAEPRAPITTRPRRAAIAAPRPPRSAP